METVGEFQELQNEKWISLLDEKTGPCHLDTALVKKAI
jgi:hypothetical protein